MSDVSSTRSTNRTELGVLASVIVEARPDDYAEAHPNAADVMLLEEVAGASLTFDLGLKRDLYALR
jgi:hypothetical protein